MTDIEAILLEYDFPVAYLDQVTARLREDGEALRVMRAEAVEAVDRLWSDWVVDDAQPVEQVEATPSVVKMPPPMTADRWRARRVNAGRPRWDDLYARNIQPKARVQPIGWAVFGYVDDYDIVAQLDPKEDWAWRIRLADVEGEDEEQWIGGWVASEEEANVRLAQARLTHGTKTGGVTQAIKGDLEAAISQASGLFEASS